MTLDLHSLPGSTVSGALAGSLARILCSLLGGAGGLGGGPAGARTGARTGDGGLGGGLRPLRLGLRLTITIAGWARAGGGVSLLLVSLLQPLEVMLLPFLSFWMTSLSFSEATAALARCVRASIANTSSVILGGQGQFT